LYGGTSYQTIVAVTKKKAILTYTVLFANSSYSNTSVSIDQAVGVAINLEAKLAVRKSTFGCVFELPINSILIPLGSFAQQGLQEPTRQAPLTSKHQIKHLSMG
jgi:hypothetical protein